MITIPFFSISVFNNVIDLYAFDKLDDVNISNFNFEGQYHPMLTAGVNEY
jgi:hypothetical protein